jgi:ligand-binding sensor domain-containing protein
MRLLFILLFFFAQILCVFGQKRPVLKTDYQTEFEQLSTKDGLSSNKVLDILQDKVGYLWFATTDGLNRYDGYKFLVYKNTIGDTTSLSNNLVTCLEEDIHGNLWVGTLYGLNRYNRKTNQFEHFFKQKGQNSLSDNHIRALFADQTGILWVETVDGVLNKIHLPDFKVEHFTHTAVNQAYYHYHSIYPENDSILWIGGRGIATHRFNINQGKFKRFKPDPNDSTKKREADIACYFEDSKANFYVSGLDGVYLFDKKSRFKKILKSSTFSILEDTKKRLWFGTGDGIYKQSGEANTYFHYTFNPNNPTSLGGNHVNKLFQDRSGVIWVATNSGISKYSPLRHNFMHYYHVPDDSNTVSSNRITDAVEDTKGMIWLATANSGLVRFDRKNGAFKNFKHSSKNKKGLRSDRISNLYIDKEDNLWIGLWSGKGFQKFNPSKENFELYSINPKNTYTDWYNDFLEDSKGNFYLGVWGGQALYNFKRETKQIQKDGTSLEVNPNGLPITKMYWDESAAELWLCQPLFGVDNFSQKKSQYNYFRHYLKDLKFNFNLAQNLEKSHIIASSIPKFTVLYDILKDQEGTLWLATDKGVLYKVPNENRFDLLSDRPKSKPEKTYTALAYDRGKHIVWAASAHNLLRINTITKMFTPLVWKNEKQAPGLKVKSLIFDSISKNLFLSTEDELWQWSQEKNFQLIHSFSSLVGSAIDQSGDLWLATRDSLFNFSRNFTLKWSAPKPGVKKITAFSLKGNNAFIAAENKLYSLNVTQHAIGEKFLKKYYPFNTDSIRILSINQAYNGEIIHLGTNKGLFRYYPSTTYFEMVRPYERKYSGNRIHLCTALLEDIRGDIWIGTSNTAISKIPKGTKLLQQYHYNPLDTSSFWGDAVSSFYEDSKHRLWIGAKGLNLYRPQSETFSHFTTNDGLPSNSIQSIVEDDKQNLWLGTNKGLSKFNLLTNSFINYSDLEGTHGHNFSRAGIRLSNGELLFGGDEGFIIFNPDSLQQNLKIPPVVITQIKLFDKIIRVDLSESPRLVLGPKQNTLTFEFASLDYNQPLANRYLYKLEGLDPDWQKTDSKNRSIRYTNIPPGEYTFLLRGTNNNGVWGDLSTPVNIYIRPPFWMRWWFIILAVILWGGIVVLLIRYREKELVKAKKTQELEHRFLRSQMNPHFIFNSLGAIQSYIFKNQALEAGTYLSKFSKLVRLILDNSRNEEISLLKEIDTLKLYLELQRLRFPKKLSFLFEIDENLDVETIKIPPMMLQPFIENSIEHGFVKTNSGGIIRIRIKQSENGILLETEDNGVGIRSSIESKAKLKGNHEALATKITRQRIRNLNWGRKVKISLEILDLSELNTDLNGTRVSINIPINLK